MKNFFALLFLIIFGSELKAQIIYDTRSHFFGLDTTECNIIKVNVDEYTNKRTVESEFIEIPYTATYHLYKLKNNIRLFISVESQTAYTVYKEYPFYFKFTDGTKVVFNLLEDEYPSYSNDRYCNSFDFVLSGTKLSYFKNKNLSGFKCYVFPHEIDTIDADFFRKTLNCLIQTQ